MSTIEGRMAVAYRDGIDAAQARKPRINPHDGASASTEERVLSVMWARGYSKGNPVDLEAELEPAE